jgi:hypothetical protein
MKNYDDKKNHYGVILLVLGIIFFIIIGIFIMKKSSDKYIPIFPTTQIHYIPTPYTPTPYTPTSKIKKENENIGCTTLVKPEEVYSNGKFKGAYLKHFTFLPYLNDEGTVFGFKPLYICFMKDFDSEKISRTYKLSEIETVNVNGRVYDCVRSDRNTNNPYGIPNGFCILDPLERIFARNIFYTVKESIKKIVKERWQPFIKLSLIFMDDDPRFDGYTQRQLEDESDIRISFDPKNGCNSKIGTNSLLIEKTKRTMNFSWFDVGTVLHEFGHLLGFIHEHQSPLTGGITNDLWKEPQLLRYFKPHLLQLGINPDKASDRVERDKYLTTNIYSGKYTDRDVEGSDFDIYSIMLYSFPSNVFVGDRFPKGLRQNSILSFNDVKTAAKMYPLYSGAPYFLPIPIDLEEIHRVYDAIYNVIS